jgi:hypothetical protein
MAEGDGVGADTELENLVVSNARLLSLFSMPP